MLTHAARTSIHWRDRIRVTIPYKIQILPIASSRERDRFLEDAFGN
ncbi:MAG TPA: hypothetical protein VK211_24085 [Kamptonema sp.]|nr:hypothetical protein [Kamptonema sp.]